ncbi:conserved hypothetical protein [Streptomyces sviceus ATCC 29083]|uniref:Uncharacterized protein n=1 Tax=Streptomyces sviceus (strain ATCC 29083 / DSM 924 / JCM 4929 / NBRC 13980 / NCIMB 11184 / NRRL 5439 / UC 5370) TaxID=463191 RepID=B5HPG9_STRX2|nr:conserved hypothetical protein [Streptomyces sviceus ATCC 29083]
MTFRPRRTPATTRLVAVLASGHGGGRSVTQNRQVSPGGRPCGPGQSADAMPTGRPGRRTTLATRGFS